MSVSLSKIVDITVQASSLATISSDFNLGLIIGNSLNKNENELKIYNYETYQDAMVQDGYSTTSPEYKGAVLYFAQSPKSSQLAIGQMVSGQTTAAAFTAFRSMNDRFYGVAFVVSMTDQEIADVAALVEATPIPTVFFYQTDDSNAIAAGTTNIFKTLKDANYRMSFGFYSTDTNAQVSLAMLGLFSGLNSMDPGSAYTAAYKSLAGITAENLTDTEITALTSYNGNVYTSFGNTYDFTYPMVSGASYHLDEVYLLDAAKFTIQSSVVSGLVSQRKVPQTESGMTTIINFISSACETLARVGMIGGGIWKGGQVQSLKDGDALQNGYFIQSGSMADQSIADRLDRKTPPIYVALLATGAIEHVVIRVFVSR